MVIYSSCTTIQFQWLTSTYMVIYVFLEDMVGQMYHRIFWPNFLINSWYDCTISGTRNKLWTVDVLKVWGSVGNLKRSNTILYHMPHGAPTTLLSCVLGYDTEVLFRSFVCSIYPSWSTLPFIFTEQSSLSEICFDIWSFTLCIICTAAMFIIVVPTYFGLTFKLLHVRKHSHLVLS